MTGKIGTYQWMAPEVITNQKYTEKADVFSFGIILWEIAVREPPYKRIYLKNTSKIDFNSIRIKKELIPKLIVIFIFIIQ